MPSWSDGPRRPDLRPDAPEPPATPPVPERRPVGARGPRRRPGRRLVLAARQGRSGGHRPPRGRERLHRGGRLAHLGPPAPSLFEEIVARIEETDLSVPVRKGPWWYYSRTVEGRTTPSTAGGPRRGGPAGTGRRLRRTPGRAPTRRSSWTRTCWPRGTTTSPSGNLAVSPDHRWLAYSTDTTGGERFTCASCDLDDPGRRRARDVDDTSYGVAWANDNATVFYTRVDEAMRPFQLWRHRVGTDPAADVHGLRGARRPLLPRRWAGPRTGRFILIEPRLQGRPARCGCCRRRPGGRLRGRRAPPPGDRVQRRPRSRRPGPGGPGRFLIVTNDGAEDFRLMAAPDDAPAGRTGAR